MRSLRGPSTKPARGYRAASTRQVGAPRPAKVARLWRQAVVAHASRTAGGAAQYVARSVDPPADDERHERGRRAMLAPLAVDPQPWRDASKVREGGNWGGGRPAHLQNITPFAPARKATRASCPAGAMPLDPEAVSEFRFCNRRRCYVGIPRSTSRTQLYGRRPCGPKVHLRFPGKQPQVVGAPARRRTSLSHFSATEQGDGRLSRSTCQRTNPPTAEGIAALQVLQ
jgi:hypothetical protein